MGKWDWRYMADEDKYEDNFRCEHLNSAYYSFLKTNTEYGIFKVFHVLETVLKRA